MCGIYGIFGHHAAQAEAIFADALHHRGPDDRGIFCKPEHNIAIGHTRLSIIDLSTSAHQPMTDASGRYVLVFNGEIYNYKELKAELEKTGVSFQTHSDTEVVLNSFIHWGETCLDKLRGMFAFAIYDQQAQTLFLARDRFGIKPLLYTFNGDRFTFSSELKPLLNSEHYRNTLDADAVQDYFRFGSVQQPKTILQGVSSLLPGHCMTVRANQQHTLHCYYQLADHISSTLPGDKHLDYATARQTLLAGLEQAARYHMVADVDVGAFLSGGVDSTAIVALMQNYSDKPIKTFSIGFDNQNEVFDELSLARQTAQLLNTDHHEIRVTDTMVSQNFEDFISAIDQPSIDGMNTFLVSKFTAEHVKVAVSGLGGDEVFGGYDHFRRIQQLAALPQLPGLQALVDALHQRKPNAFTKYAALIGSAPEQATLRVRAQTRQIPLKYLNTQDYAAISTYPEASCIQRVSLAEISGYLANTLLHDTDTVSMAHSLEVRPMLLDHKLVELGLSLPDAYKVTKTHLKQIFVDTIKDQIPEPVWNRKKTGFEMPFAKWLNNKLNGHYQMALNQPIAQQLLNKSYLNARQHAAQNKQLDRTDWKVLIFLHWAGKYQLTQ